MALGPSLLSRRHPRWKRPDVRVPIFARCLLLLSNRLLFSIQSGLFFVNFRRAGRLEAWIDAVLATSSDDNAWLLLVACIFLCIFYVRSWCPDAYWHPIWLLLAVGLTWYADLEVFMGFAEWISILLNPPMRFLVFTSRLWIEIGHYIVNWSIPRLFWEECASFAVMLWWLVRTSFILFSVCLEKWHARKMLEEEIKYAIKNPFHAELEKDFGQHASSHSLFRRREMSNSSGVWQPEKIKTLDEKHSFLASERWAEVQLEVAGDELLPDKLTLNVRRDHIVEDSWRVLLESPIPQLLSPEMVVVYDGEDGVDAGGLTRDWFETVGKKLLEGAANVKGSSLLALGPDRTLVPRSVASNLGDAQPEDPPFDVTPEAEDKYRSFIAVGRFLALAVLHKRPLPLSFSLVVCKHFLCVPVGMEDVRRVDPEFYNARVMQVLKKDGLAELMAALEEPLYFMSAPTELMPAPFELKPGGQTTIVNEENKTQYVQLLCEAHLCGSIRRELQCMLQGFWDLLPLDMLHKRDISASELSVLISGVRNLDCTDWQSHSRSDDISNVHTWFWQIVEELDPEQRCMLLHFTTGSSRLPPGGFAALDPPFTVEVSSSGSDHHLPHAHTCVNQLVLHHYTSMQQLREKLLVAMSAKDFAIA